MELRGQEGELGMPISLVYNPPIRELSTTKVTSSTRAPTTATTVGLGRRSGNGINQSLDHQREEKLVLDPVSAAITIAGGVTSAVDPNSRSRSITNAAVRYRECLKNHAASIGGHVVDGCGEFMPSGEEGTPGALKCAACECHRNFHRKEAEGQIHQHTSNCYYCYHSTNGKNHSSRRNPITPPALPPPPPLPQQHQQVIPAPFPSMVMAFGGGAGGGGSGATESSSEDINTAFQSNAATGAPPPLPAALSKKRFRTKFSQDLKEKMLGFAEKVGWKIQKQDEESVQQFCAETGVKRQVLKVWMHNNKLAMKKKES